MANEERTILLAVSIDQGAAKKQAEELTVSIKKEREELAMLEKQYKAGIVTDAEYGAEKERLNTQIKENSRQLTINRNLSDSNAGSIAAQRAELSRLKDEYIKSANPTKAQALAIRALSDDLKKNESALGDNTRNVGNYIGSISHQREELERLRKEYVNLANPTKAQADAIHKLSDELKENEGALKETTKSAGDFIKDINIMGINVGDASDSLKEGFDGFQTFTKGVSLSRGALVALTAIPIVLFLVGLVAFFKATDAGADKLEQGMNALKTAFTVFFRGLVIFKDYGVNLFNALIAGAKGLYDIMAGIQQLDFERVGKGIEGTKKAFNDASDTVKNTSEAFSNLASTALQAAAAEVELTKRSQDLADAQDELVEKTAKAEAAVSKALLTAKDSSKSQKERIALLKEAGSQEKATAEESLKLKQEAYRQAIITEINQLAFKKETLAELDQLNTEELRSLIDKYHDEGELEKRAGDDALNRIREKSVEVIRGESDLADKLQQIDNRTAALRNQFNQANDAAIKKRRDEEEARRKKQAEYEANDLKARLEGAAAEEKYEIDRLQRIADAKLKALQRQLEIEKDFANQRRQVIDENFNEEELEIAGRVLNQEIADSEAKALQLENEKNHLQALLQVAIDNGEPDLALQQELTNKKIEIRQFEASEKERIQAVENEAARLGFEALTSLIEIAGANAQEQASFQKAITLFQIGISTANALVKGIASSQDLPYPANLLAMATTIATVLANVAKAKQLLTAEPPKAPKAKFGGGGDFLTQGPQMIMVGDNPGGVERVTVEPVSGKGKTVIGAGAKMIHLAGGGSVTTYGGGQYAALGIQSSVNNQIAQAQQFGAMIKERVPVLVVETLDRVTGNMDRVIEQSTV